MNFLLHDPWPVLGIAPTDDERAIKRAYAAKLKTVRPDEDPEGFQALVEARDLAMLLRGPMPGFEEGEPGGDAGGEADDLHEDDAPSPAEAEAEPADEPGPDSLTGTDDDVPLPEDRAAGIAAAIAGYLSGRNSDGWSAESAMSHIAELSLAERSRIEPDLLEAAASCLTTAEPVANGSYESGSQRFRQRVIIMELDDEFGWSTNDRHLYTVLGSDAGDAIDALHRLRNPTYTPMTASTEQPRGRWQFRWRWGYIWVFLVVIKLMAACSQSMHYPRR